MDHPQTPTQRYPFIARAEIIPEGSSRILTRVTELSLHGCYLDFVQLSKGAHVSVKLFAEADFFEANATVVYSQPNIGLGVAFRDVKPYFATVLQKWLLLAMKDHKPRT